MLFPRIIKPSIFTYEKKRLEISGLPQEREGIRSSLLTYLASVTDLVGSIQIMHFTITAEIHARSLANIYFQYADKHMNFKLKLMRRVSEREPAIR